MDSTIVTNAQRAATAQRAIDTYQQAVKTDDEDALSDLLCDLMHRYGEETFAAELERARSYYGEELLEEDSAFSQPVSSPPPAPLESMPASPIKYVCTTCGSDDLLFDAWACWDERKQEMELSSTLDMTYCKSCGGETRDEAVPIATPSN